MDKFKEIRPIVLGIAKRGNKLLVSRGYDRKKDAYFYRCLGGGIEFAETSDVALKREFKEELNIEIDVKEFLGIAENIFTFEGKTGHELVLFYSIDIPEKYYQEKYVQHEDADDSDRDAIWVDVEEFKNGSKILYPIEIFKYL